MLSHNREGDGNAALTVNHGKRRAAPLQPDVHCPVVGILSRSEIHGFMALPGPAYAQQIIVPIQENRAVCPHAVLDLQLFPEDVFPGAEVFNMGYPHVCNHSHIYRGNLGNHRHLSRLAHAKLQNSDLVCV